MNRLQTAPERAVKILTSLAVLAALTGTAAAAPLTCDTFKERLTETVKAANKVADIPPWGWIKAPPIEGRDVTLYNWHGIVGLTGDMNCGPHDEFLEFSIELRSNADHPLTGEAVSLVSARFENLAAAATQTFVTGQYAQIFVFQNGVTNALAKRLKADVAKGQEDPGEETTFQIDADIDANFTAQLYPDGDVTMNFRVGPAEYSPSGLDDAKKLWAPKPESKD